MARGLSWVMQGAVGNLRVISLGWGLNSMGGDVPGAAVTVVQLLCVFRLPLALWITPFNPWIYSTSVSQGVSEQRLAMAECDSAEGELKPSYC